MGQPMKRPRRCQPEPAGYILAHPPVARMAPRGQGRAKELSQFILGPRGGGGTKRKKAGARRGAPPRGARPAQVARVSLGPPRCRSRRPSTSSGRVAAAGVSLPPPPDQSDWIRMFLPRRGEHTWHYDQGTRAEEEHSGEADPSGGGKGGRGRTRKGGRGGAPRQGRGCGVFGKAWYQPQVAWLSRRMGSRAGLDR